LERRNTQATCLFKRQVFDFGWESAVRAYRIWKGEDMKAKWISIVLLPLVLVSSVVLVVGCGNSEPANLTLATTTSTADTGLLDYLLPVFEKDYNIKVKPIAVGSGEALKMGERGDADVLLVHSKLDEEAFVKSSFGLERVEVMWNDFVILGPQADPSGIKGDKSAVDAFKKIAAAGTTFVSRADDSGTNKKEMKLWTAAGVNPVGQPWYVQTGQGMGETITVTNQKQGYTLSDRATYLARKDTLQIAILVEGDKQLLNPYSVIVVNPKKHPGLKLNTKGAGDFVWFMTGKKGQEMVGAYRKGGVVLFHPDAKGQTRGKGD
jgi:tungstate transport system substrate-binding protein